MIVIVTTDLGREMVAPLRIMQTVAVRCDGCGRETAARFTDGSEFSERVEILTAMDKESFVERIEGRYQRHRCPKCK